MAFGKVVNYINVIDYRKFKNVTLMTSVNDGVRELYSKLLLCTVSTGSNVSTVVQYSTRYLASS